MLSSNVRAEMNYPYIATSERATLIKNEYKNIKEGDTKRSVVLIMNEPDEIHELYEPIKYKPKVIGKTYWYIVQRISNTGSVNEKKEVIVRVSFDLNDTVTKVDRWGF